MVRPGASTPAFAAHADGDITRLRDYKLLNLDEHRVGPVLGQDEIDNAVGHLLNQFKTALLPEFQKVVHDILVVDGFFDPVSKRGAGEINAQVQCDQQLLRLRAFLIRDADAVVHFEVDNRYSRHKQLEPVAVIPGWAG